MSPASYCHLSVLLCICSSVPSGHPGHVVCLRVTIPRERERGIRSRLGHHQCLPVCLFMAPDFYILMAEKAMELHLCVYAPVMDMQKVLIMTYDQNLGRPAPPCAPQQRCMQAHQSRLPHPVSCAMLICRHVSHAQRCSPDPNSLIHSSAKCQLIIVSFTFSIIVNSPACASYASCFTCCRVNS